MANSLVNISVAAAQLTAMFATSSEQTANIVAHNFSLVSNEMAYKGEGEVEIYYYI
jgi:hypothetical protein